ncbi:glycosyltransferase [Chthonobacter rhizosphaerae]|uniref:glycosyltransferase n=1 Tax=Chthonobacter rhizosphaerae TaxID=2735553 RepID=UPI0015EF3F7F
MTASVTFIVPAYNAAATFRRTWESLCAQSVADWTAIVVNDGSTDGTAFLVREIAATDPRLLLVEQGNAGAAAARNYAVSLASTPFLVFLDADDWVAPEFLSVLLPKAIAGGGAVIPFCGYRRVTPDGRELPEMPAPDLDGDRALTAFADHCALAIHSAVVPREAYLAIGGMRSDRSICEDWEMWLRLAARGLRFQRLDRILSFYRVSEGSLTSDPCMLVANAVEVIDLGRSMLNVRATERGVDALPGEVPSHISRVKTAVWAAATCLNRAVNPGDLLALLPGRQEILGYENIIAASFLHGVRIALKVRSTAELVAAAGQWSDYADRIWCEFETVRPGTRLALWQHTLSVLAPGLPAGKDFSVGPVSVVAVDLARATVPPVPTGRLVLHALCRNERLLTVVPLDGSVSLTSVVGSLAAESGWGWSIDAAGGRTRLTFAMICALLRNLRRIARLRRHGDRRKRFLGLLRDCLSDAVADLFGGWPMPEAGPPLPASNPVLKAPAMVTTRAIALKDTTAASVNEPAYWDAIFASEDPWNYTSAYEVEKYRQTLEILPPGQLGRTMEIACAEGLFTLLLAERGVEHLLAVDISPKAIERAAERCSDRPEVEFRLFDLSSDPFPQGMDLIICSEVLYYLRDQAQLDTFAARVADALKPGGCFVTAHAHLLVDEPSRTGFDWDNPFGVAGIVAALSAVPGFTLEETLETELYAIHRFRKSTPCSKNSQPVIRTGNHGVPLDPEVERTVVYGGAIASRSKVYRTERTAQVPVLMYHRVAADGPAALTRYRVTPDLFLEQLRMLRRLGYHSISSRAFADARVAGRTLPGRPVVITFDDGYEDFAEYAQPALERNDFTAEVFVVTNRVGGRADWDSYYGEPAPLMSWSTIRQLAGRGTRFGSHLATHKPMSHLAGHELLAEAVGSRRMLERELSQPVVTMAAPFGVYDARSMPILRRAGYRVAFSTAHGVAGPLDPLLRMPRIEVQGDTSPEQLAALLGRAGDLAAANRSEQAK